MKYYSIIWHSLYSIVQYNMMYDVIKYKIYQLMQDDHEEQRHDAAHVDEHAGQPLGDERVLGRFQGLKIAHPNS